MDSEQIDKTNLTMDDGAWESATWLKEVAYQLAIHNERQERFENEWANLIRPQISSGLSTLWPKLLGALDKASKGIFG